MYLIVIRGKYNKMNVEFHKNKRPFVYLYIHMYHNNLNIELYQCVFVRLDVYWWVCVTGRGIPTLDELR
jgi:hypothetical protein